MPDPVQSTQPIQQNQPPAQPEREVQAGMGDTVERLAQENGVTKEALLQANPQLKPDDVMLGGERIALPENPGGQTNLSASNAGIAAAGGREGSVQAMMNRAYEAGRSAPQQDFDGPLVRTNGTKYEATAFDANRASAGRYNANPAQGGTNLIYASQNRADNLAEMGAYKSPTNPQPMANQSMIDFDFKATVGPDGRGGVADLDAGLRAQGIKPEAVTIPKGNGSLDMLHRVTGEHPYSLSQQAGKGAVDAGAAAIKAPSAVAPGSQIDILPANAKPGNLNPTSVTPFDADGIAGTPRSASGVNPMAPSTATPEGPLAKPAGSTQSAHRLEAGKPIEPRASGVRYGAAGGFAGSLINDGVRALNGENVTAGEVARNASVSTVVGGGSAKATELLASQLGGKPIAANIKAGGIVGGAIEAVVSTSRNADLYSTKQITAAQATANVAVDTGVAVAAGASGAAIGAAVGSVVPVAGTAVGAVVGFVAGMGVHYGIQALGNATGAIQGAKDWAADKLSALEQPLSKAWDGIVSAKSAVGDAISGAWGRLSSIW
jgi:LysM repeat protein